MSNPKISLINYIDTPPNHLSNNMLAIADLDANIHLEKQATLTMAPAIMSNYMKVRLLDVSTMESSNVAILQLPGISKQVRHIHIFPQMQSAPLISL